MDEPTRHGIALRVRGLQGYYGQSHVLQGVDLLLEQGVHAVVGRNGMGKTTLCNAIMGLLRDRRGSINFMGEEIVGLPPYRIAGLGIGYTPQGRRLWPSLTVDEHLLLSSARGSWTRQRVYDTFPRLYERRRNNAGQLSGGEQQMLAISRSLLQNPRLLVLDEPTEGLAPVIVDLVQDLLLTLVEERSMAVLLIEQNISVATAISKDVGVMVNGRIRQVLPAQKLAADTSLQERLLGVGRVAMEEDPEPELEEEDQPVALVETEPAPVISGYIPPTRWSAAAWRTGPQELLPRPGTPDDTRLPQVRSSVTTRRGIFGPDAYVAGTFDTKGTELMFVRECLARRGLHVRTVDLSTSDKPSPADVPPHAVAAYHSRGAGAVFGSDRGESVRAMSEAFARWIQHRDDLGGIISAGGSGGTALVSAAMRTLPIGTPKIIISTVGSGDISEYVGSSDIMMMYSVTDILGLNRISRQILENGAHALAGMMQKQADAQAVKSEKPGLGLTMFGVTTPAVQQITDALHERYDCMVFHATGTGGRSMEKLADSGLLDAAIDLTTTEVCDMMMGGVFPADEDRFGAFIRTRIPYVGSVGALDMVNFGPRDTVPQRYRDRLFVEHNPHVTLMRTTTDENRRMGAWIAGRLNEMEGSVRFLLPEGGVSALDVPGGAFHAPQTTEALFDAIASNFRETQRRRLVRTPHHINDPAFARIVIDLLDEVNPGRHGHGAH